MLSASALRTPWLWVALIAAMVMITLLTGTAGAQTVTPAAGTPAATSTLPVATTTPLATSTAAATATPAMAATPSAATPAATTVAATPAATATGQTLPNAGGLPMNTALPLILGAGAALIALGLRARAR